MDRALFLDRDGVLNVDHGYVGSIDRFEVLPGVFEALSQALAFGFRLVVITNQSGIARGYFTEEDYDRVERHMVALFAARGISFTAIYHCPHHRDGVRQDLAIACDCRKPSPGMILGACAQHGISPSRSVLAGDKASDLEAGRAAHIGHCFLINASNTTDGTFHSLQELIASPNFEKIARA